MELRHTFYGDNLKDGADMEYHGRLHAHDNNDHEIHVFMEGRGVFEIEKKRHNIDPGSIFLIRPGEFHSIIPGKVSLPLSYYVFIFDPDAGVTSDGRIGDMLAARENLLITLDSRDHILVQEIHRLFQTRCLHDRVAASALFSGLLFHWYGASVIDGTVSEREETRNINRMHVKRAIFYLKKHIGETISVQELAKTQHLTPEHLSRIFTKEMGIPPRQYMTRLKMEEAMSRLIQTDRTMGDIAEELGYSDAFHFSHVFTKFAGVSPVKYRQTNTPADPHSPETREIYMTDAPRGNSP